MNGPGGDLPLLLWQTGRRACSAGRGRRRPRRRWRRYRALGLDLVPGDGLPRGLRARLLRRLADAAARLRDLGARGRARVRDRLRARRLPDDARDRAGDRARWSRRGRPRRALWRPARAAAQPGAGRHLRALGALRRGDARGADRRRARRLVPRVGGRGDRRARSRVPARRQLGRGARGRAGGRRPGRVLGVATRRRSSFDFRGWTVFKTGPWGQGPVFLQQLALLDGLDLGPFLGVEHLHGVLECAKLAFADREAWYGDSAPVPLDDAALARVRGRAARAGRHEASGELRPGLDGRLPSIRAGAGAARGRGRADARRHLPSRRRRPLGQPRLGHAERRVAAELARDRRPRVLPGHARADVLARGRAAGARWSAGGGRGRRCRRRWGCATTGP